MKKHTFIIPLIIVCLYSNIVLSQNKTVSIKLDANEKLITTLDLKDNGIIIKTGKTRMNSKKLDWKLKYYSAGLDLIWDVPLETIKPNAGIKSPVIATPSGSYVYHREVFNGPLLTQIDKKGTIKTYPLQVDREVNHINQAFCDEKYLYFVSTLKGQEFYADKKMLKEKIIFKRISHSNFSEKNFLLDLPALTSPKTQGFWTYAGHSDKGMYFLSPTISIKEKIYKYDIVSVNSEGRVTDKVSIDLLLEGGKHMRPSANYVISPGNYQYNLADFNSTYSNYTGYSATINMRMDNIDGFGEVVVDDKNNAIYIFGLYGPVAFKLPGAKYEGYFIYKYDLRGKPIWKVQNKVSSQLATKPYFKVQGVPEGRSLALRLFPKKLKFQIFFKSEVHTYEFTYDGKPLTNYYNKFSKEAATAMEAKMSYPVPGNIKSFQYMGSLNPADIKNTYMQYFTSSKGEILLLDKRNKEEIELLRFDLPE